MPVTLEGKLVIAISSRALFDLDDSNKIFEEKGEDEYTAYQIEHENEVLGQGVAFPLIKRLLELRNPETNEDMVEIILVSKNDPNTGLRVLNSIESYQLNITRAAFSRGRTPYKYLKAFNADLFLSANPDDVKLALENGYASATIYTGTPYREDENFDEIRIAFDGDAVIFSDESEKIYQEKGLEEFKRFEKENREIPMAPGPFKAFLTALNNLQNVYKNADKKPIRTALVTARNAPAHARAIKTLREWGIGVDEAFFLGGLDKAPILESFNPHIFFDDQHTYCITASKVVPTGHVPIGVKNSQK
ncbi:5'-nucleotidase [Sporomusa sphaeroides DSM 2875]|uniref:5'-nucleotidase n=1 Tax=Sporomusa sphaeroides TaxID=47679 RepID=UPI00202DCFCD|nr:5'-nucleotidase [Sporomusa sphaeroides]MCM0759222.1 5'-nucleotidase [Sporomusa sphaeroides DSM 2875]